jgi:thiamine biosynthesis lipoprotein
MKQTRFIMGMPITIEIISCQDKTLFKKVFNFFRDVDKRFSPYKKTSEVTQINQGLIKPADFSPEMKHIISLAKKTTQQTAGFFDIYNNEVLDPSGLVKGWAILEASSIIKNDGYPNFYIEAGGDIQSSGTNKKGERWKIGIRNPFNPTEIVKVVKIGSEGVATSGSYERGAHIYNPNGEMSDDVLSLTVIGKNIYEADRFATAAFAMGQKGIEFIDQTPGLEGYAIRKDGIAFSTRNFEYFVN